MKVNNGFNIVYATREDIPQINDIVNHYIRTSSAHWSWDDRSLEAAYKWYDAHNMEYHPIFVAKDYSGNIVGYSSLSVFRGRQGYQHVAENSVYVNSKFLGLGIGKKLMDAIINHTKSSKINVITAWVDSENINSINFHKKLNFITCGELRNIGKKFGKIRSVTIMQLEINKN